MWRLETSCSSGGRHASTFKDIVRTCKNADNRQLSQRIIHGQARHIICIVCGQPSFYELHTRLSPTLARDSNSNYLLCNGERRGSSSQEAQGITRVLYFLAVDSSMKQSLCNLMRHEGFMRPMTVWQTVAELVAER